MEAKQNKEIDACHAGYCTTGTPVVTSRETHAGYCNTGYCTTCRILHQRNPCGDMHEKQNETSININCAQKRRRKCYRNAPLEWS